MITQAQAKLFADDWLHAWNRHHIQDILSHYADTIEFISPFVSLLLNRPDGVIRGKAELEAYFLQGLTKYPELHFHCLNVLPGANSITILYRSVDNLLAAEVMEIDGDGKVTRVLAHYTKTESS